MGMPDQDKSNEARKPASPALAEFAKLGHRIDYETASREAGVTHVRMQGPKAKAAPPAK